LRRVIVPLLLAAMWTRASAEDSVIDRLGI